MSNFHFDLALKLSKGEMHDFSGGAKILREGAKRFQGRCVLPPTSPQNPAMSRINIRKL
jgi:hypothetical protein